VPSDKYKGKYRILIKVLGQAGGEVGCIMGRFKMHHMNPTTEEAWLIARMVTQVVEVLSIIILSIQTLRYLKSKELTEKYSKWTLLFLVLSFTLFNCYNIFFNITYLLTA